jgi:integrase
MPGRKNAFRIRWMDGGKQREKTFRGSRSAADEERRRLVILGGGRSEQAAQPVSDGRTVEALMTEWTAWHESTGKATRTVEQNRDATRLRIVPSIGNIRLQELTTRHIDEMFSDWTSDGRLKTTTMRRYFAPLKTALGQAVKWGWIDTNPAANATLPRGQESPRRPPPPAAVVVELIKAARDRNDHRMVAAMWLAFGAGLRRGEVAALKWTDFDFNEATIHIHGNMDRQGRIGPTKTHENRTVKIDPGTVAMLEELQEEVTGSETFVIGLRPDQLTDRFRRLCKLTGYVTKDNKPLYSFQGERKAHATELAGRGASPANVQARLGHANLQTTLGYYVHPLASGDEELADTIGQIMRGD